MQFNICGFYFEYFTLDYGHSLAPFPPARIITFTQCHLSIALDIQSKCFYLLDTNLYKHQ